MGTAQPHYVADADNSIEFDQLCPLCASLFDERVIWEEYRYRPHHDIFSLASSAAHGCHMCSLVLGQVRPENVKRLQQDLGELVTRPSRQIGINISGESRFILKIAARGSTLLKDEGIFGAEKQEDWSVIGVLWIRFEEDDDTNATRSEANLNCSDTTIAQIIE